MTIVELFAMIGASVGSGASAYVASRRSKSKGESAQIRKLFSRVDELRVAVDARPSMATLSDERVREIVDQRTAEKFREIERELQSCVSMEEFHAYVNVDGERREKLIEKIGELSGKVSTLVGGR